MVVLRCHFFQCYFQLAELRAKLRFLQNQPEGGKEGREKEEERGNSSAGSGRGNRGRGGRGRGRNITINVNYYY